MIKVKNKTKFIWLLMISLMLCSADLFADDDIKFTANGPNAVVVGSQFNVEFSVNSNKVNDFRAPSFDGFDELMGPSRSVSSYTSYVNGKRSHNNTTTFTYVLSPHQEGTFTLEGATVSIKGKTYSSNKLTIKVLPDDGSSKGSGTSGTQGQSQRGASKSSKSISSKDVFVLGSLSKTKVHEQEAVLLTYKLYASSVSIASLRPSKMPDFNGFHSQELDLSNSNRWSLENYKGRNYQTATIQQVVLFPQRAGKLTIDPMEIELAIEQAAELQDPFDAFFFQPVTTVKRTVTSPTLTLHVEALPVGKPLGFSGGVGNFSMTSSISTNQVKANEAVTIKLILSGTGNMKLISSPEVDFPSDFEVYDPKVEDQLRITSQGLSGNRVIEYLAIPRHEGNFKIPPIAFSYFDTQSNQYKTLKTKEFDLKVTKGDGTSSSGGVVSNFTNQEELKILGEDIRFIKLNDIKLHPRTQFLHGTWTYRLFFIIPFLLFILLLAFNAKRAKENSNIALMRTKKANKVARNRMKAAAKLLKAEDKEKFYDEVLKALWGYVSDKLTIPLSKLSKDNIEEELTHHGVDEELTKAFIGTLDECEFAKFAPGDDSQAMDKTFKQATDLIGRLENVIKH